MMAAAAALQVHSVDDLLVDYLTRDEFAEQLGISPRTAARWEVLRIGPPVTRIGRTPYYSKTSTREWLKAQEVKQIRDERRARR